MTVSASRARAINHSIVYLLVTAGAVVTFFPLLWTISTSLKTKEQLVGTRIVLIPDPIAWGNYAETFRVTSMLRNLRNTMIIVVCAEFGSLVVCSLVAYAFARIPFPGRDTMFVLLLSSMMLPGVVTLIPYFVIFDRLGWINTFLPLIVPRFLAHNPFYIFLMRQFFQEIPQDLSDAARMDGCSEFSIWRRIVMPISTPVLVAVGIFTFQWVWNDFLYPLVYISTNMNLWTLALGLYGLDSHEFAEQRTHLKMAYSVMMIVPMIAVFAIGQRYFIQGITFTGLKG